MLVQHTALVKRERERAGGEAHVSVATTHHGGEGGHGVEHHVVAAARQQVDDAVHCTASLLLHWL
jgi:hypothetical protein